MNYVSKTVQFNIQAVKCHSIACFITQQQE